MSPGPATVTPLRPKRRCPECGRAAGRENYPFCSARCKTVDLHRWLSGSYVIPATEEEPSDPQAGDAD
ncbi:DNA gyrase inhibitor YacG [Aurantimonas sp. C2-6-R+9]|uniref:DNA gyrase inhibitor YacG n=1 Tax=unclassified Aurantimonas TaxID=2638230 RepID=UPI002E18A701|nr:MULTISPECIES: DNA gyrase inhibitor YacG [unclassified Aurantimonas]MEC5289630.1 DNA gyrase inhibitor YacG [Aurantimonas sp. C2-3-R2]MEC5379595.1 DNA gyrase inhibitor YacG [Aurantimonas sp. C2-6-R+9]MEC5410711.1 DNA gyrase inhibitor YacG [Aurantimonas sp. C2-4-R8]